ncbi:hypothetical protein WS0893 [Wolinella succinogenes]|uniref:Uncharacterized protein n=1 Tax=Wolinella succinogenes (strain ATCC 29543 / DSM 1740 / CCUG 13145 / JCM 31913 / LMG 7466 / NCTC 11488 / FDC 602W) TaxID=273121 RepID=Q7MS07_WOLSU|nr:hypothetical protein WS0893 [Wolinella succinogenes]
MGLFKLLKESLLFLNIFRAESWLNFAKPPKESWIEEKSLNGASGALDDCCFECGE